MSEPPPQELPSKSYIVILSGTHVTGKETIALSLASALGVSWLRGENAGNTAWSFARAHENRGATTSQAQEKYGETWFSRMQRIGLLSDAQVGGERPVSPSAESKRIEGGCLAVCTNYALRTMYRNGMRDAMAKRGVRTIFVILQISKDTLCGRTLGAEEPELAKRIMKEKTDDLEEPGEEERDCLVVDSLMPVDSLTAHVEWLVRAQVASE